MKNKIFLIVTFWIMALILGACSDYLDETPNKSGSAYIYHMDQLYGLTRESRPLFIWFSRIYTIRDYR